MVFVTRGARKQLAPKKPRKKPGKLPTETNKQWRARMAEERCANLAANGESVGALYGTGTIAPVYVDGSVTDRLGFSPTRLGKLAGGLWLEQQRSTKSGSRGARCKAPVEVPR